MLRSIIGPISTDPRSIAQRLTAAGCTITRQHEPPRVTVTGPDGEHVAHHARDACAWLRRIDRRHRRQPMRLRGAFALLDRIHPVRPDLEDGATLRDLRAHDHDRACLFIRLAEKHGFLDAEPSLLAFTEHYANPLYLHG